MSDMFRVDGKVAVVVGGAGGIGEALGHGLAQYGARVVIADINLPRAEEVARDIRAEVVASEAVAFKLDIADEKSVAQLVEQVVSKFGTVDILVNSQGINLKKPATEFPVADWDFMFNINVRGIMLACREFGKVMVEKEKGKALFKHFVEQNFCSVFSQSCSQFSSPPQICSFSFP